MTETRRGFLGLLGLGVVAPVAARVLGTSDGRVGNVVMQDDFGERVIEPIYSSDFGYIAMSTGEPGQFSSKRRK